MKKRVLSIVAFALVMVLMVAAFAACGKQGPQGPAGPQGEQGEAGNGVESIIKTSTEGLVDTYTITFTDGTKTTFTVANGADGEQGIQGIQGVKGEDGHTPIITIQNGYWYIDGVNTNQSATGFSGATGNGISNIAKTSTEGLVDTYTITYTNGTTTIFTVTNGADGAQGQQGVQGIQGVPGKDGHTPVITIENGKWYIDGVDTGKSADGLKGDTGNGISDITKTSTEGLVDTYTITYTNGTSTTFTVTNGAQGIQGIQGEKGEDGHSPVITIQNGYWYIDGVNTNESATEGIKGDTGNGISSIAKTKTEGLVDTYTITFTNGDTTTFTVTNGTPGVQGEQGVQGIQGVPGKDGHTPVITIENGRWYIDGVDTGKSAEGIKGDTGNGIEKIEKTKTEGLIDTYTITYTNGNTTTFTVTNGAVGAQGQQGIQGIQGEKGEDGHTPVITIQNGKWYIDGVDTGKSAEGVKGDTGNGISSIAKTKTEGLVDTYTITFTNGDTTTFTITNGTPGAQGAQGIQGIQGEKGADGHTPVITIQNGKWYIDGVDSGKSAEGVKGDTGNGISSIAKTNTVGLVDTYTITFTNGDTTTFTVTNGAAGAQGIQGVQGIQGEKGADGHTPVITIQNGRWYIDGVDSGKSAEGIKGDTGNGISSIIKTSTVGLVDIYTITFTNGDTTTFTVTNGADGAQGQQGIQGIQGEKGEDGHTPVITIQNGRWYIDGVDSGKSAEGVKGDTGNGISSISKTNTVGLVDTYTITFTNGDTTTFTVTNGAAGAQGIQGEKGDDGHSPVITIQNGKWYIDGVDSGVLAEGVKGDTGNGISSIEKTNTVGLIDMYTITFTNGETTTFTVTNGAEGAQGEQGIQGIQGEKGEDGHTPVITIQNGKWYIDGVDSGKSAEGIKGDTGNGISSIEKTKTEGLVDTYTITFTNGEITTFTVTNGAAGAQGEQGIQGIQGEKGEDGHTPVITIQNGKWYIDGVDSGVVAEGIKGDTGNGISSIAKTKTEGLIDTYTIIYTNGDKTTFTVTNGADGAQGQQGIQGIQGEKGEDGHTPVITIQNGKWYIDGVDSGVVAEGIKGDTGNGISSIEKTNTEGLVDTYTITFTNGNTTTFTVTNGAQGEPGVGITNAYINSEVHLILVLSNGTEIDAGYVGVSVAPTPATYTVTFVDYNGTVLKTETVESGKDATAPADPIREGYTFIGWSGSYTNVTSNLTITAQYNEPPKFVVSTTTTSAGTTDVVVTVSIENNPGILGMTLKLNYDDSVLTLTKATKGEALYSHYFTKPKYFVDGCNFVMETMELEEEDLGDGVILTLKFTVDSSATLGEYDIEISYEPNAIRDSDFNPISNIVVENGKIIVE